MCFPGFAELQTDMTDLTKELNRSQGIPFLEYKQFVTRTFFPKVRKPAFVCYLISSGILTIAFFSMGFLI